MYIILTVHFCTVNTFRQKTFHFCTVNDIMYADIGFVPCDIMHNTVLITRIRSSKMGEKFTSRVGYLIRNFRIASDMTQKELADKCGLNESTIRNYELGNRYPDEATLLNIANNLGVSFYALSDPDIANIFSALHVLFDIEWAYGLRPTMKDGEVCFKFEERLPSAGPRPQEDLDNFRKMVEYWARLRDKLEDGEISETEYYLKEVKYPTNPTDLNKEYTVSLNLDDDDQLLIQKMNEEDDAEETAELLKDLFPDFSYVKRKRKRKKE